METYQGVKFSFEQVADSCPDHQLLPLLDRWVMLFSQLGLAPVHSTGAYGNQSFRTSGSSFIITRSGMFPGKHFDPANYTLVEAFDRKNLSFTTRGSSPPSSESFLHRLIYEENNAVQAIFHGHSELLNTRARQLNIAVTDKFYDYGTIELAESALAVMQQGCSFFILKDHGFVSLGKTLDEAGQQALSYYRKLLTLLLTAF